VRSTALYDALLDDFEDDATRATDDEEGLQSIALDDVDESDDDDDDLIEGSGDGDSDQEKPKEDEEDLLGHWTTTNPGRTTPSACT
jgi:hypothetical protein